MTVTLGQQHIIGEKPTVILYTYITAMIPHVIFRYRIGVGLAFCESSPQVARVCNISAAVLCQGTPEFAFQRVSTTVV